MYVNDGRITYDDANEHLILLLMKYNRNRHQLGIFMETKIAISDERKQVCDFLKLFLLKQKYL